MKTKEEIEKEIGELSEQFKDMLTIDEPENFDNYSEEALRDVYGDDLYFSDAMQEIIKLKALLQQSKEFIEMIDKWLSIFIMNNDCEFCKAHKSKLEELKQKLKGDEK